ncbi:MAG: hypothetical protein M3Q98_06570 [Actinomycetota bacterium]|nr:hypothetical protein [Actinomycetota bacterium]
MGDGARRRVVAAHPANLGFEIRSIRMRVLAVSLLIVAVTLVTAGFTTSWYLRDVRGQDRLNEMVDSQPRVVATIETVRETTDDELGEMTAVVEIDGRSVGINNRSAFSWSEVLGEISSAFPYERGDEVTIVLDANNPDRAWDVRDRRDLSPWSHITFILFIWGFVTGMWKLFLWRNDWTIPFKVRAVPHFLWRPQTATVRVVELRPGKWWDDLTVSTSGATLVVELDGRFHVWDVHTYGSVDIEEGLEFTVWGRPRSGGWVVGLTKPHTIYPRSRLD